MGAEKKQASSVPDAHGEVQRTRCEQYEWAAKVGLG